MSQHSDHDLEIRIAFLERHIEEQDRVILELRNALQSIQSELKRVRDRMEQQSDSDSLSQHDERPPHY